MKLFGNTHGIQISEAKIQGVGLSFFGTFFFQRSKISIAIKLEGGGGLGLNGQPLREQLFLRLPL